MTINSQGEWANAIEDAEQVMLRWGHGQVRRVPDEIVEAIVAALRAPVSEQQRPSWAFVEAALLKEYARMQYASDMFPQVREEIERSRDNLMEVVGTVRFAKECGMPLPTDEEVAKCTPPSNERNG